jgi:small subunit ribosomal protein S6
MSFYENVFIARQDISAPQVENLVEEFTSIIAEFGGKVLSSEYWGLRTMAYRVRKNRKGHYVLLNIECPANATRELERRLRLNEDILRYMTIRVDSLNDEPSVMMTQKSHDKPERGERGNRGRRDHDDRSNREKRSEPTDAKGDFT